MRGVAFDAGAHSLQVTLGGLHVRHSPMSLLVRGRLTPRLTLTLTMSLMSTSLTRALALSLALSLAPTLRLARWSPGGLRYAAARWG